MGSEANKMRKKWQDYSGKSASIAENDFHKVFQIIFEDTEFQIRSQPNEFSKIYVDILLSEKELSEIYTPDEAITKHGVFPDYAIDNTKTKKNYLHRSKKTRWMGRRWQTFRRTWECPRKVL